MKINEKIVEQYSKVRVITETGINLGEYSSKEALQFAKKKGLDLVQISGNVCKIIDYGKYKYEQSKKEKKSKPKIEQIKEIKLRPSTDIGDFNTKINQSLKFLETGHKLKFTLRFKARENAHKEIGLEILNRVKEKLKDKGTIEQDIKLRGNSISMTVVPKR